MSQISVVQYNASPKINNVLQQSTTTNQTSGDNRHIIVLRKPTTKDDILITNPGRKGYKKSGKEVKTSPPPIAVARRNARERNRVKQVNNGFANLRQHIPNFIAQAFESSNGRGNKKLSKVETLRMAVEYIRSLEEILALDGYTLPTEEPKSPDGSTTQSDIGYSFVMSPSDDDDDFSSVATPSPQQYIKINTTNNTFEIVPTSLFDNSENLDPMSVEQNQLILDSGLDLNSQDLSYLQMNPLQTTTGSLSPGMYSEGSLSPRNDKDTLPQNCFIPVFATGRLGNNLNVQIKTESDELPLILMKDQEELQDVNWWDQRQSTSS